MTADPLRLLATARDVGAARHIVEIVRALRARGDVDVRFVASDAAFKVLADLQEPVTAFHAAPPYEPVPPAITIGVARQAVRRLFTEFKPNVLLSGLSTFPGGIDDAAIEAARRDGLAVPSILLLDDVGHPATAHRPHPDHIFAVSAEIADWARGAFASEIHIIGSPRHQALSRLPGWELRLAKREKLGVRHHETLITFFAQTAALPGHDYNAGLLFQTLASRRERLPPFKVVIRAHPAYVETGRLCHAAALGAGLPALLDETPNATPVLAASDAVLSCVSSVVGDYVWLSRSDKRLRAVCAYLLVGDDIKQHLIGDFGDWMPPFARQGLAECVATIDALPSFVDRIFSAGEGGARIDVLGNPDPVGAAVRIIFQIVADARASLRPREAGQGGMGV